MKTERGQSLMEYGLLLVLLGALFLVCLMVFGSQISYMHALITWHMGISDSRPMTAAEAAEDLYIRQQQREYEDAQEEGRTYFADLPFADHCFDGKHGPEWNCTTIAEAFDLGLEGGCIPLRKDCPVAQNKVVFYCEITPGSIIGMVVSTVNNVVITAFKEDIPGYWKDKSCGGN